MTAPSRYPSWPRMLADEIYAIDYIGGPRPQIRLYTERFLESGRRIRPIAFGCR